MDSSVFRKAGPAAIVASVLGLSILFPALAGDHGRGAGDGMCGYGYGHIQDKDENDDNGTGGGRAARHDTGRDNDCNEDEDDNQGGGNVGGGGNGGGGGGGDRAVRGSQPTGGASNRLGRNRE